MHLFIAILQKDRKKDKQFVCKAQKCGKFFLDFLSHPLWASRL